MAEVIKPKFIALDSNVLIGDYWLRSPSFVLLREFLNKTKADLIVPQIVFDEVVNHHKEDLEELKSGTRKLLGNAGRLLGECGQPSIPSDYRRTI
ncbi:MAG: hypothetical protein WA383_18120 [Terriglobales bacterium]